MTTDSLLYTNSAHGDFFWEAQIRVTEEFIEYIVLTDMFLHSLGQTVWSVIPSLYLVLFNTPVYPVYKFEFLTRS